ncbi:hypothetical protein FG386_000260 [Cryptosporidium ryanae]|uniref:uncharacterized protein n=1 Tax=Cryptosporidium ryanae TaxID=515981 RepID=UPI00351A3176|nr:hypothetical protein FG386_000260 [Cryptosporidium ryanae]
MISSQSPEKVRAGKDLMRNEIRNALELGLMENRFLSGIDIESLSKGIEEEFESTMEGKSSGIIRQRRFELMSNLKRPNNPDLRRRILTGEMSVKDFVNCEVSELAPDSVKQKRLVEQQKYFIKECILPSTDKIYESSLYRKRNLDYDDINSNINSSYNSYQVNDISVESENKRKKLESEGIVVLDLFPGLPLVLSTPSDYSYITPKYSINRYIEKYKDMIKDVDIKNDLIKQAKLRIVTAT